MHERTKSTTKICEINARFPLNGYLITYFANGIFEEMKSLSPYQEKFNTIQCLCSVLENIEKEFDLSKPIGILKEREVFIYHAFLGIVS